MVAVNELEEFRKQYCETIIRIREVAAGSQFFPVYVKPEHHQESKHLVLDHPKVGVMNVHWKSKSYEFDLELPPKGLFNYKDSVGLFIRLPKRQWKRGLCQGTSSHLWLTKPWRVELNRRTVPTVGYSNLEFVQALYDRTYRPFEVVVGDLLTFKKVEEALSPRFALTLSPFSGEDDVLVLWYEDQVIGELYPEEPGIAVRQPVFLQEVRDYAKRNGIKWPVKSIETPT